MCMFVEPCICVCGFTPACVFSPEHKRRVRHQDDTQMAGVHVGFFFLLFQKQLACHSLIDTDQKMDQSQLRSVPVNLSLFPDVIVKTLLEIWKCTRRFARC